MTHAASGKTRLAGIGFEDLTGAQRWLQARELEGIDREALLEGLRLSPSPDAALKSLVRLLGDHPAGLAEAVDRGSAAPALYRVLGASEALGDFLLRRPEHLDLLTGDPQRLPRSAVRRWPGSTGRTCCAAWGPIPTTGCPWPRPPGSRLSWPCAPPTGGADPHRRRGPARRGPPRRARADRGVPGRPGRGRAGSRPGRGPRRDRPDLPRGLPGGAGRDRDGQVRGAGAELHLRRGRDLRRRTRPTGPGRGRRGRRRRRCAAAGGAAARATG
ncbi:bifunctional glutamine-synthetase adenylyltransferase/deadenyltransferase [Rothia kristinae]|nr:bifunctional glutamine-synthetase adenylyltransferase/deadenyltransferase [Rothia kristinae]